MKFSLPKPRTLALFAVLVPLAVLLGYVALRSGPLAPVNVTEAKVQARAIEPALFVTRPQAPRIGACGMEGRRVHPRPSITGRRGIDQKVPIASPRTLR